MNEHNRNVYINQSEIYIKCSLGRLLFHLRIAPHARFSFSILISDYVDVAVVVFCFFFTAVVGYLSCGLWYSFFSLFILVHTLSHFTRVYRVYNNIDMIWLCNGVDCVKRGIDRGEIGQIFILFFFWSCFRYIFIRQWFDRDAYVYAI